ncbi:NAD(P)/FAD-dependent oxidoreductase [Tautonia rosea]|uniref:NAD(P)/FAD-dependent oxidoreductase n=1 Tax=Tautonia rosea TaxID=2728037 RepID=UPI0019D2017D
MGDRIVERHHQILIVGGGTAGITVAARLRQQVPSLDVAIVEPSTKHYYQPLWTLVGGGIYKPEDSEREEADLIPPGTTWIKDAVSTFDPDTSQVTTKNGDVITYDWLIVAAGIQINWDKVKGLRDAVGHDAVCSNYDIKTVPSTWRSIQEFRGGTAIFTQPTGPVKCGGGPQKIMYLAEEAFERSGVRKQSRLIFATGTPRIFAVEPYASSLEKVVARKGIETLFKHNLIEIRADRKEAVFRKVDSEDEVVLHYDMIHVTPPMGPPDFIAQSPLADAEGWVNVDKFSLRHLRYSNVFGIGDASSLPTSKTGAAIRKQAPVLVENLFRCMNDQVPSASYDGYTSCPVVTGYNSLIMAEFDYDKNPAETFPFDQSQERFSMFFLKKAGLPSLYWHGMLKGRV